MSSIAESIAFAAPSFTGRLLRPTDPEYDDVRRVHNGLIDKRPAIIARCRGAADVVDAVLLARKLGLAISVRGGGHNVAGRATIDDGLMIDLSPMKGIQVDAIARTARAQGGVLWREFNRETQLHGLATTGGVVGSTGIAGLTLGGGLGWLMPKHGLALDNLRAADMVMADGTVVRASADTNPDLFWAIRGGGGNFGIAASLEYALHRVGPMITGGVVAHPLPRALDVLRFFRDTCASLPDEAMLVAALQTAPDGSNAKLVAIVGSHCGPLELGDVTFRSLKAYGPPALDAMGPISYSSLNGMLDPAFPKAALSYWKAQFVADLTDDAIRTLIDGFQACPSPMSHIIIEHFHGAASRVPVAATACTMRVTGFNVIIASQWTDPGETERGIRWAREAFASLTPYLAPTRYVNYLEDDARDGAAVVYGSNLARLRAIKTKYDPDNFFRHNVNILPE
ncbi:MAG TPA: FAD-binding oxidoreductase [Vicinamibacterales bacterium]|jgi:FAD/FMN-containing dehydrogenase|nr:FAD-binding oxidoreductase [Vicinamibacterales bacterium]